MFGNSYFGARYFGDAYFGQGADPPPSVGSNELKYWFNGVPLGDLPNAEDKKTVKYWSNGVPFVVVYPGPAGGATVSYYPIQFLMGL